MAKFIIGKGIDSYIEKLDSLVSASEEMIGRAIYEGAKIVTDQVASNISSIPVDDKGYYNFKKNGSRSNGITSSQKAGLKHGLGIASMRKDGGFYNVKVGMDGYNNTRTKTWPSGQPNAMIARSVESGTSFMSKHPFIAPAVSSTKAAAEQRMAQEYDKQLRQKGF